MLFIVASIIFFLLSIRWILLWTYFWQKNGYSLQRVVFAIKQLSLSSFLWHFSMPAMLLFLILLYSGVIFNDGVTSVYHIFVTFVFVAFLAGIFVKLHSGSVKFPKFSIKALTISLITTFLISFLFMIPLVDNFLWLVILVMMVPLLIALLVALLAFPTEIYEDYVTAKTKEVIQKKHIVFVAIIGSHSLTVREYADGAFKNSQRVYIEQATGFVQLAQSLRTAASEEKRVYVFEMPIIQLDRAKIASITKPTLVIMTSDVQGEKAYKELMHLLPRNVTLLSYKKNILFNKLAKKNHKHILLYRLQKSPISYLKQL